MKGREVKKKPTKNKDRESEEEREWVEQARVRTKAEQDRKSEETWEARLQQNVKKKKEKLWRPRSWHKRLGTYGCESYEEDDRTNAGWLQKILEDIS